MLIIINIYILQFWIMTSLQKHAPTANIQCVHKTSPLKILKEQPRTCMEWNEKKFNTQRDTHLGHQRKILLKSILLFQTSEIFIFFQSGVTDVHFPTWRTKCRQKEDRGLIKMLSLEKWHCAKRLVAEPQCTSDIIDCVRGTLEHVI